MKIENLETFIVDSWLITKITTDNGLIGVGESTFFGWPRAAEEVVLSFRKYLIGKDPLNVEHHWNFMYRSKSMRGGSIVGGISSIDQALWDIKGKYFDTPVWQLLGGKVRDKVRAMLCLPTGTCDEVAKHALIAKNSGFTALKVFLYQHGHSTMRHSERINDLVERLQAIRDSVGWDCDIGVEIHRNMTPGDSIVLAKEIEHIKPYFFEDPIAPDSVLSFGEVSEKSNIPMAAGERNLNIWEFREYIEKAGVHYIRPDVGLAGGFTHLKKICALAEAHHQGVIPHAVPSGPIATAAHIQLGACVPNWEVQEHIIEDKPVHTKIVNKISTLKNGFFEIPDTPGIGIEFNEDGAKKYGLSSPDMKVDLRDDGSVSLR